MSRQAAPAPWTVTTVHLDVTTDRCFGVVDLTELVGDAVARSGVRDGCVMVFCRHTTCALLVSELENGAIEDLEALLRKLVPEDAYYAHDDRARRTQKLDPAGERSNGHSHVAQMLLGGMSQSLPVSGSRPQLGRWQRLLLLELDEPRSRSVVVQVWGA